MSENTIFRVSSSPHIATNETTSRIMADVLIALMPCVIVGTFLFGIRALAVVLTSAAAAMFFEWAYQKITKQKITTGDLSAAVTGVLLALALPPTIPLFMVIIGDLFAIVIVKQLFGGIGCNFVNPALAARAFMVAAWSAPMTASYATPFMSGPDAITSATPLAILKGTATEGIMPSITEAFMGIKAGCIGEVSGIMILVGFVYLLIRGVISYKSTVTYLVVFAALTYLFGKTPFSLEFTLYSLLTGTVLFGSVFMITDYTTSPSTDKGRYVFAAGCALLTFLIRRFGGYPEGFTYAVLLMNICVPFIDKYMIPKKFGARKKAEQKQ